jgi:2-amino-4-hydroxy-6-hydroxymethyldihydropteridine diphosphokinase
MNAGPGAVHAVYLALGANLDDPRRQLAAAIERLREWVAIDAVSAVYRTAPVGYADQPDFLNLVCRGTTALAPQTLLRACQRVETELGRVRSFRNGPRTMDIDLLAHGERVMDTATLTLPHPRMHLRAFVLVPLVEISPEWRHPVLGATASELLRALEAPGEVRREGGKWEVGLKNEE